MGDTCTSSTHRFFIIHLRACPVCGEEPMARSEMCGTKCKSCIKPWSIDDFECIQILDSIYCDDSGTQPELYTSQVWRIRCNLCSEVRDYVFQVS